ncbi:MAG: hypothetical protein V1799_07695 [bacterium]
MDTQKLPGSLTRAMMESKEFRESSSPMNGLLYQTASDFEYVRRKMIENGLALKRRIDITIQKLEHEKWNDACLNSLGELQSLSVEFDINCGEFARLQKFYNGLTEINVRQKQQAVEVKELEDHLGR